MSRRTLGIITVAFAALHVSILVLFWSGNEQPAGTPGGVEQTLTADRGHQRNNVVAQLTEESESSEFELAGFQPFDPL